MKHLERFGTVPRDVRLTTNGRMVMVTAIAIAAAAVALAIVLPIARAGQLAERDLEAREAVAAEATITRVTVTKGDNPSRAITYRYSAAGTVHENTVHVGMKRHRDAAEGGHLAISYRQSRPARSWLAGDQRWVLPLPVLLLVPAALLLIAALIAWRVRHDCILLSEGRFASARVVSSKKISAPHGHRYAVQYEFRTLAGATVTAKTERGRPFVDAGATVTVVYHREDPRWNAIYPLALAAPVRS